MKIDSTALAEIVVQAAVEQFGDQVFRRRALMNAVEKELRNRNLWTLEDDDLSGSVGTKSKGLALIDFRISDLAKTGELCTERRNAWCVSKAVLAKSLGATLPLANSESLGAVRIQPMSPSDCEERYDRGTTGRLFFRRPER